MRFALSTLTTAALLASVCASNALASGYHFGSQSAASQGTANANAAEASDASLLFYNPAGMTRLKGINASGVLTVVVPDGEFRDQGSTTLFNLPTGGSNGGKFVKTTAVPHAYLTYQLNKDLSAGFAMFVPFGSKSEYEPDWTGRYNTIGTELKTIALNPSIAYKLTDKLSLGAGLTAQFIEGKLSKGADFGSGALALVVEQQVAANAQPGVPIEVVRAAVMNKLSGLIKQVSGNPLYSGGVKVEGDDWGYGFNLGLMYNYDENTRFGLAYRSSIKHKLQGESKWTVKAPAGNLATLLNGALPGAGSQVEARLLAAYTDSDASLKVDTPESLSFSFFRQENKLAVMGDLTLTRHSRFKELRIDFANQLPDSLTPEGWINTIRASFGVNYLLSDTLKLRGGLAFDQSPVTERTRTPSLPDNDRTWVSTGLNWKLDSKSSMDFALSYVHVASSQVNSFDNGAQTNAVGSSVCNPAGNTSSCATIRGRYQLNSALLGIQYNREF